MQKEPQREGESPPCILLAFIEHLLCASPTSQSLSPRLFPLRLGGSGFASMRWHLLLASSTESEHLLGRFVGPAYSAITGSCSQL